MEFILPLRIGDGALGFWKALDEIFPSTRRQRCWVHKTANISLKAYNHFIKVFEDKYPKAVGCLVKDKEDLFTFYDFPAIHWIHIRTTNPIESTFATVKLRTTKTKGCGSRMATLTMVFKLTMEAARTWKKLKGHQFILHVLENKKFVDGELVEEVAA